jgi:hypothetical protein
MQAKQQAKSTNQIENEQSPQKKQRAQSQASNSFSLAA